MFLFLFLIYGLSLIGKRRILLIFTDVLPSIIVVGTGFFYFYVKYCDVLNSDECWPVRQTRDLYFPVLVNLPIICFLVALFFFPILYLNRDFSIISKLIFLSIFIGVFIFFGLVGNGLIEKGSFVAVSVTKLGSCFVCFRYKCGDVVTGALVRTCSHNDSQSIGGLCSIRCHAVAAFALEFRHVTTVSR
jgi:hypothetical protein